MAHFFCLIKALPSIQVGPMPRCCHVKISTTAAKHIAKTCIIGHFVISLPLEIIIINFKNYIYGLYPKSFDDRRENRIWSQTSQNHLHRSYWWVFQVLSWNPLFALGWAISIHGGKQYVVTTHRLIFKRGIINRTSHELLLRKCEGVQVDQSIPGRMFGYGTVNVTTGEVTNSYKYIKHPVRFTTEIHEQISHLRDDS